MRHAHKGPLARFAARYFRDDAPGQPRIVRVGMPGYQQPLLFRPAPGPGEERWERPEAAGGQRPPWDDVPGQMTEPFNPFSPEETETWGPDGRPDRLLMDEQALTDGRVAPGYVPEAVPYVPDIPADLTELPAFREAVAHRTRDHARECLCGCRMAGQAWGERMVAAGMHLTGTETAA